MKRLTLLWAMVVSASLASSQGAEPLGQLVTKAFSGKPGSVATYRLGERDAIPDSVVDSFTLVSGRPKRNGHEEHRWLRLRATKANGKRSGEVDGSCLKNNRARS